MQPEVTPPLEKAEVGSGSYHQPSGPAPLQEIVKGGASSKSIQLRRIQISPLPEAEAEADAEAAIVCKSPAFAFADSGWAANRKYGADARMLSAGRAVKAEVKLLVKTADAGREAVEICSIREFVELDSGGPGPFSRIFQTETQTTSGLPLPASGYRSPPQSPPPLPANRRNRTRLLVTTIHPSALGKPHTPRADIRITSGRMGQHGTPPSLSTSGLFYI